MNRVIGTLLLSLTFTFALAGQANSSVATKDIVVELPSDLPVSAQQPGEAMFLYSAGEDRVLLYLEQNHGRTLTVLDVSKPGQIESIGQVSIDALGPFDFVQYLGHSAELVHYRNHSGFAVLSFKDYKQPLLKAEPKYLRSATVQTDGSEMLLVSPASQVGQSVDSQVDSQYEVISVSNPSNPAPLATIKGVIQRVDRPETGTIFLLTDHGLNVVRCLNRERDHEDELYAWYN
jgi:hypothetical protein